MGSGMRHEPPSAVTYRCNVGEVWVDACWPVGARRGRCCNLRGMLGGSCATGFYMPCRSPTPLLAMLPVPFSVLGALEPFIAVGAPSRRTDCAYVAQPQEPILETNCGLASSSLDVLRRLVARNPRSSASVRGGSSVASAAVPRQFCILRKPPRGAHRTHSH